ncbi:hypothetical protein GCM10023149_12110 [Mucilaginibacter gynuensis]|uniref:Glycoside hydrolase family 5 domain-containing protein n=1 Tax=Mucilaginibacter gynuensis TaxID=1302236 RepID=A0ABP8G1N2_9SPHI
MKNHKYIVALLIVCAVCFTHLQSIAQKPVAKNGWLQVKNGQVVNQHGKAPQLRGISMSWSIWEGQKYYNSNVVNWLCTDFKATIIRASMAIEHEGGYLQDSVKQVKLISTIIDQCIKNGVYVLIDWHDHNAHQHLGQAKRFFATMAQKYKGVPNVIYEIWNEPEDISWLVIKKYANEVIPVIRKYDSKNLIIVGSPRWDQDVNIAALDPIKDYNNIAYSFHFYASDPYHQENLRAKADKAIKARLPLFVTEWGVGESNGDGVFDKAKTEAWLKWLEYNQLSWADWNLTDKAETTGILIGGANVNGNWKPAELSPAGAYIRDKLRLYNK